MAGVSVSPLERRVAELEQQLRALKQNFAPEKLTEHLNCLEVWRQEEQHIAKLKALKRGRKVVYVDKGFKYEGYFLEILLDSPGIHTAVTIKPLPAFPGDSCEVIKLNPKDVLIMENEK